jgi:hypothetical protein
MGRACSIHGVKGNKSTYRILVGNPTRKTPLRRRRHGWEEYITMDLRDIGRGGVDWIDVAQDRVQWQALMNTEMNLHVP